VKGRRASHQVERIQAAFSEIAVRHRTVQHALDESNLVVQWSHIAHAYHLVGRQLRAFSGVGVEQKQSALGIAESVHLVVGVVPCESNVVGRDRSDEIH
jgi:hypothetical protein